MLTINIEDNRKTYEQIFFENAVQLCKEFVSEICSAIDKGQDDAKIYQIICGEFTHSISVKKDIFLPELKKYMICLIEFEEYEYCALAQKYIDFLQNTKQIPEKIII